jgi:hypothetical protein
VGFIAASADNADVPSQSFWAQAYENLMQAKRKVAQRYNANCTPHQYPAGDTVVYRLNLVSSKALNVSAKLLLKWSKHVVIARFVRPNVALLANPDTGVIVSRAHVCQLKPYFSRCPNGVYEDLMFMSFLCYPPPPGVVGIAKR